MKQTLEDQINEVLKKDIKQHPELDLSIPFELKVEKQKMPTSRKKPSPPPIKEKLLFEPPKALETMTFHDLKILHDLKNSGKIKILALDVATKTGFCSRSGSGVWNLTPKKDESKGMRLIRFKSKLKDICAVEEIKLIVFEGAVSYGKFPNMVGAEMIGVLKLFCEENAIEYRSYMPTEIKKSATGKGNATKDMMVAAAQANYQMEGNDDNQADAMHLYHHALKDLSV